MKTIGKLKLNQLSKSELEKRELNFLKGGYNTCACVCGCGPTIEVSGAEQITDDNYLKGG